MKKISKAKFHFNPKIIWITIGVLLLILIIIFIYYKYKSQESFTNVNELVVERETIIKDIKNNIPTAKIESDSDLSKETIEEKIKNKINSLAAKRLVTQLNDNENIYRELLTKNIGEPTNLENDKKISEEIVKIMNN